MKNNINQNIILLNKELERKNNLIKQLQQRIIKLIDEKNSFSNQINKLKEEINNISAKSEKVFNNNKIIYDKRENELNLIIKNLEKENEQLKNIIEEKKNEENILNNELKKRVNKAEEEINNLKIMNNNRDNILLLLNHFLENIKSKLDLNQELHFDFIPYIFDKSSFINNLKILENEIINKIKNKNKSNNKQKNTKNIKILINDGIKNKNNFKNMIKKQNDIFINRLRKKKKNLQISLNKNKTYFRTPKRIFTINNNKSNNKHDLDDEINSYLLSINTETVRSRLNNNNTIY